MIATIVSCIINKISTRLTLVVISIAWCFSATQALAASERYTLDNEHTSILFFINHVDFSKMVGQFRKFNGSLAIDREHPEKSELNVTIQPNSIQTSSAALDDILQTKQFFDTKKYSSMHYTSTKIRLTGQNTAEVTGNLRMHGSIHPVTLHVTLNKDADFYGTHRIGFSATGKLKRSDFAMIEGIPLVSDEVELMIETEAVKAK